MAECLVTSMAETKKSHISFTLFLQLQPYKAYWFQKQRMDQLLAPSVNFVVKEVVLKKHP